MSKKKQKKTKHSSGNAVLTPGKTGLQAFAQTVFKERTKQFQKSGAAIDSVYEGLDFDPIRVKRRISSVVSVAEEVKNRFSKTCPDVPGMFSLEEDWIILNSCPVSAFDHIEKYVFTTLGAAIWLLDHIRDNGKTDQLNDILRNAPPIVEISMPDVWDPCHSQQLLRQVVSVINYRNSDCSVTEKAIRKNKATIARVYMDRPTAESKIDHNVPSRQLYDQIIGLIDPEALSSIEHAYTETYWEWLRRYYLCRVRFNQEEQAIRAEIDSFKDRMQATATQAAILSHVNNHKSVLSNPSTAGSIPALSITPSQDQLIRAKALEYQNIMLFDKQEEFNARFNSFIRELGEFSLFTSESIAKKYGEEIAEIWKGFEIDEPYSMCMAFLSLLDRGSDLPWCYFPSVILQSNYVSMLPWSRTRFIPCCDDIWEHYDADSDTIVPGPSPLPLSKKIKVPELDDWYRLQYHDSAQAKDNSGNLFNLSHIVYEVTGCLMPRRPERHLTALNTLNRYGINSKKANQNLLYCMSLLSEAKHQSLLSQFPVSQTTDYGEMPDSVDMLRSQITALREELSECKQALQEAVNKNDIHANQIKQLRQQLIQRDHLIHDLGSITFDAKMPTTSANVGQLQRIASYFAVFSSNETWINDMKSTLSDVHYFQEIPKDHPDILRTVDTVWIQPKNMSFDAFWRILIAARKANAPVRIFPFEDFRSCASLLVHADISR